METSNIYLVVMAIIFTVLGFMMMVGKADFVMKRYVRESKKYNLARMRFLHAISFILISIVSLLIFFGVSEIVVACIIIPFAIILAILQFTWAKRNE